MDANRFDALSRSLSALPSRRSVLRLLVGSALGSAIGWLGHEEGASHDARKSCKKKKGNAKKKCLKKAKKHNATHTCTPRCGGGNCGDDGCGGSCGTCTGGTFCTNGACTCPPQQELCKGVCRAACGIDQIRNPDDCTCCVENGRLCQGSTTPCCSGTCSASSGIDECQGRPKDASCTFDEQCASGDCRFVFPSTVGTCGEGQIGP